jgi:hypothetical protein
MFWREFWQNMRGWQPFLFLSVVAGGLLFVLYVLSEQRAKFLCKLSKTKFSVGKYYLRALAMCLLAVATFFVVLLPSVSAARAFYETTQLTGALAILASVGVWFLAALAIELVVLLILFVYFLFVVPS